MQTNYVTLKKLIELFKLKKMNEASIENVKIISPDLNRVGLQLAGYFDDFANERIQIIGNVEWGYIQTLPQERLRRVVCDIMQRDIPCLIFARNLHVPQTFIEMGDRFNIPILKTHRSTTSFIADLLKTIDSILAETITIHGVLIDINGVGTLILGKSGIGKSEIALELVKRGHRFVADDAIEVSKLNDNTLIGKSPEIIRNFMEIRGIGIVDMTKMYGVGSVRDNIPIELVVKIVEWSNSENYNRTGLDEQYYDIMDKQVPLVVLPIKPGRNLAVLLEAAARYQSLRKMGHLAVHELDDRIKRSQANN